MDFLDPEKQRSHLIRLAAGYVLIGVAVLIATLILLYQAYGFGLDKDGEVIQNGLVFMSSQPSGGRIYLNGKQFKSDTNAKLPLPSGQYRSEIQREGYVTWKRAITVDGGSVLHLDYPKLFPTQLSTATVKAYPEAPGFATQSPDRHWLLVQQGATPLSFDSYDLSDPKKVASEPLVVPDVLVTAPKSAGQSWKLVEWATDNRHLLVQHSYAADTASAGTGSEYLVIDRQEPASSLNLTKTLQLTNTAQLSLRDKKFDAYYVFDAVAATLGTTSVDDAGKVVPLLDHVLSYKSYGAGMVLYMSDRDPVTNQAAVTGRVFSVLRDGDRTYKLRDHATGPPYLTDLARYSGDWYIAVGSSAEGKEYIYMNPQRIRKASQTAALVPVQILRMQSPNYLQFSSNTQYIMVENGTSFADYDTENDKRYSYVSTAPLDTPAVHATWMDAARIMYVSAGKVQVFDYDNLNGRTLSAASPDYLPFFDRDYDTLYTLAPATGQAEGLNLTATSMLTKADQ